MSDPWTILGLVPGATLPDLDRAYKKLAMKYHPDKNRTREAWAHKKFTELGEAREQLKELITERTTGTSHARREGSPSHASSSKSTRPTAPSPTYTYAKPADPPPSRNSQREGRPDYTSSGSTRRAPSPTYTYARTWGHPRSSSPPPRPSAHGPSSHATSSHYRTPVYERSTSPPRATDPHFRPPGYEQYSRAPPPSPPHATSSSYTTSGYEQFSRPPPGRPPPRAPTPPRSPPARSERSRELWWQPNTDPSGTDIEHALQALRNLRRETTSSIPPIRNDLPNDLPNDSLRAFNDLHTAVAAANGRVWAVADHVSAMLDTYRREDRSRVYRRLGRVHRDMWRLSGKLRLLLIAFDRGMLLSVFNEALAEITWLAREVRPQHPVQFMRVTTWSEGIDA